MQENLKKIKRDNALKIFISVAMVLVFCASLILAICAPVFKSDGVASAYEATLPDDGIPNPNFIKNSDFSKNTKGSASYSSSDGLWTRVYDNWQILNADVAYVGDSLNVNFDTSTAAEYKRFCSSEDYFYTLEPNKTYTLTLCYYVHELSGNVALRINNAYSSLYDSVYLKSGDTAVGLSTFSGLHITSCTFTLARSLPEGRVEIIAQSNGTSFCNIDLYYFKLEEGSAFTGYVPDYKNTINDLQNEVDSQKDTVANYDFASRFLAPTNTPSRQVYFNLNRNPVVPDSSFFKSSGSLNRWYFMDYFSSYDVDGNVYLGNSVATVGWEIYYHLEGLVPNQTISYDSAVLLCNGTKIFQYDCSGDSLSSLVYTNPTWLVSSNMQFKGIPIYYFDFSGSSAYFTLRDTSAILKEQFSNSSWGYSFALQDLNNWKDLSNDVYYNNGYNNGFSVGKESGFSSGRDSGYKEGFSVGKESGYNIGYNDGVVSGQDYSFTALLGAVFDVPISAFKGLFNFEVLGVNMTSFVSSLLALCVIVVIVKICLGGK